MACIINVKTGVAFKFASKNGPHAFIRWDVEEDGAEGLVYGGGRLEWAGGGLLSLVAEPAELREGRGGAGPAVIRRGGSGGLGGELGRCASENSAVLLAPAKDDWRAHVDKTGDCWALAPPLCLKICVEWDDKWPSGKRSPKQQIAHKSRSLQAKQCTLGSFGGIDCLQESQL